MILLITSIVSGMTRSQEQNSPKIWEYQVDGQIKSVSIDGSKLLIGSTDDKVRMLEEGNPEWIFNMQKDVWKVRSNEGLVVASSFLNDIYVMNSTGDLEWEFEQNNQVGTFASSGGNVIVVSTIAQSDAQGYRNKAIIFNKKGARIGEKSSWGKRISGAEVSGNRGYYWTNNNLYSFPLSSEGLWNYKGSDQIKDIVINDGRVIIGMEDGTVTSIGSSRLVLWKYEVGGAVTSIDADGSRIAVGTEGGKVVLLESGARKIWEKNTGSESSIEKVHVSKDRVAAGSNDGVVHVLGPNSGKILWKYDIGTNMETMDVGDGKIAVAGDSKVHVLKLDWYEKISQMANNFREEGDELFSEGNYSEAISRYEQALDIIEEGDVFIKSEEDDRGASYLEEMIQKSEDFSEKQAEADDLLEEASNHYTEGRYQEAIDTYQDVIIIYEEINRDTSVLESRIEKIEDEKSKWETSQTHLQNATELFDKGQYNKSISEYEKVKTIYRELNITTTEIDQKIEEAQTNLEKKARSQDLEEAKNLENQGDQAMQDELYTQAVNKYNQSKQIYQKYEKEDRASELSSKLVEANETKNKYFKALDHLSKGDEYLNDPNNVDFDGAIEEYRQAEELYREIDKNTSMIQRKIEEAQSRQTRGQLYIMGIFVVILVILVYLNFFR